MVENYRVDKKGTLEKPPHDDWTLFHKKLWELNLNTCTEYLYTIKIKQKVYFNREIINVLT